MRDADATKGVAILQRGLPQDMRVERALPGVAPADPDGWLHVDEAYSAQMQRRAELMDERREDVVFLEDGAHAAAQALLDAALALIVTMGFERQEHRVRRPDGVEVGIDRGDPMGTLGHLVQEDLCLLQKRGAEHVLTGAVLCFPASWRLSEKAGRPLTAIHGPVEAYDADIARRVQRLFDGVRIGRPLWRFNRLWYADAELYQPRSETAPSRVQGQGGEGRYLRSERQTIFRLPKSDAVVFSIHTYVLAPEDVEHRACAPQ